MWAQLIETSLQGNEGNSAQNPKLKAPIMKLIETFKNAQKIIKVYWCAEWQEYQAKLYGVTNGKATYYAPATYHTDDKEDAICTARKMLSA